MDNRELLELAALACGFEIAHNMGLVTRKDTGRYWNPAEDDGDCARMERQLRIDVTWYTKSVESQQCFEPFDSTICVSEAYAKHTDEDAARRMASLRVAAEIGKRMKEAQW